MPLTADFRATFVELAKRDPKFRRGLLTDAVEDILNGDVDIGRAKLRVVVNATIGFAGLAKATGKNPKSLMNTLANGHNPTSANFLAIIRALSERENVRLAVRTTKAA
jgi:DNA-binding phage protein